MRVLGTVVIAVLVLFGLASLWLAVPPLISAPVTLVALGVFLWRWRGASHR